MSSLDQVFKEQILGQVVQKTTNAQVLKPDQFAENIGQFQSEDKGE